MKIKRIEEFYERKEKIIKSREKDKICIVISDGTCGKANGSDDLISAVKEEIMRKNLEKNVDIRVTGCLGFCQVEPIMIIYPMGIFYPSPPIKYVKEIIEETVIYNKVIEELLYTDHTGKKYTYEWEIPFYKKQKRIILENNKKINPNNIEDYISIGGYEALVKVIYKYSQEEVIKEINM